MGEFYHPLPKTNILLRHENLHVTVGFAQPHGHMYFTFKPHHPVLNGRIVGKQEVIRFLQGSQRAAGRATSPRCRRRS
jgi:hypothetical protein